MRPYEVVYIFDPALERGAVDEKLEAFHAALGCEVRKIDHWGVRRLAYPIRKSSAGYYVVARAKARAEALPEFERLVKLDQETLRYLVVVDEGLPTSGESILASGAPEAAPPAGDRGAREDQVEDAAQGEEEVPGSEGEPVEPEEASAAAIDAADSEEGTPEEGANEAEEEEAAASGEANAPPNEAAGPSDDPRDELPPREPRRGPPEYAAARGRGRRRDGPAILRLNYKDVATLCRFLTDQGKILPKRTTRVTARFQRQLGTAVKRARFLGLLPYVRDHGANL